MQSRESISKQENGKRKIQPGLTRQFISEYNNPWLALEAVNEYIGWGITQLNSPGKNKDGHFLQLILEKELKEALGTIPKVKWTEDLYNLHSIELQDTRRSAEKIVGVIHFSTLYLATICETYDISWLKVWEKHHNKLKSKGYVI
ncbi:XRE family transcriptional regulator [Halobacillus trueperi]|uniref:XRE family transcriptional regulator n=1 Tax=Halobacillus trueperi TaxID=156205 RepID=A0A3D8VIZ4_9BACI|nr:XRE family transcriptional regulator [Halobacillus trueperi]